MTQVFSRSPQHRVPAGTADRSSSCKARQANENHHSGDSAKTCQFGQADPRIQTSARALSHASIARFTGNPQ